MGQTLTSGIAKLSVEELCKSLKTHTDTQTHRHTHTHTLPSWVALSLGPDEMHALGKGEGCSCWCWHPRVKPFSFSQGWRCVGPDVQPASQVAILCWTLQSPQLPQVSRHHSQSALRREDSVEIHVKGHRRNSEQPPFYHELFLQFPSVGRQARVTRGTPGVPLKNFLGWINTVTNCICHIKNQGHRKDFKNHLLLVISLERFNKIMILWNKKRL